MNPLSPFLYMLACPAPFSSIPSRHLRCVIGSTVSEHIIVPTLDKRKLRILLHEVV